MHILTTSFKAANTYIVIDLTIESFDLWTSQRLHRRLIRVLYQQVDGCDCVIYPSLHHWLISKFIRTIILYVGSISCLLSYIF